MLADNERVLKQAAAARQAQQQEDTRLATAAADAARNAKRDATLRDAAARKAAEDGERTAKAQQEAEHRATMETERQAKAKAQADAKAAAEAERMRAKELEIARKVMADSEKAARESQERQAREAAQEAARAQAEERRRLEAERQKWEPVGGGFFRRLFGGGSSEPKPNAPAPAVPVAAVPTVPVVQPTQAVPVPQPVAPPVVTTPVVPPPAVTVPVATAPDVPLKIISDSAELVRQPAPAPAQSFFTPGQPTVDPLAEQIELLKQRAAAAQGQPVASQLVPAVVPQPSVPPPVASAAEAVAVQPAAEERPGFWSRVGSFFVRSKKDQSSQAPQAPPRAGAQWPPNNIVVRDPKAAAQGQAAAQVPPGLAPGGVLATNFPRVQYAPVTNQGNLFLPRAMAMQTNIPGMPQPPAPPREVREMRPGKSGQPGITELQGPSMEIIAGRIKAPLRVYATGAGKVVPDLNGAELEVGQTYILEAQPARGAVFLGWTGSIETNSPVLRFVMRTGTILSASFQFGYNLEREAPEVAVTAPADGARLAAPTFSVQGMARDNMGVARVEVSVNDGPWEPAQGTDNWTFQSAARPGANYVRVRAVDQAGNLSQTALRSLYYSAPSHLTVRVSGAGSVEPDWNGRLLDVGGLYELRATPAAGHVFTGWSGGASGTASALQFVMQTNQVIEANFAPRVASLARGMFNGLVYPTNSLTPAKCGFFQIEVGADGSFTGFLRQGVASHPLTGKFDLNGQATASVARAGQRALMVTLQLDTTAGERLSGRFLDDGQGVEMFAYRQVYDGRTSVTPLAGRYTFVMPGATNSAASPGGDAFGEIVVDAAGNVKLSGELPDGTPVRHEAVMGRGGLWPLHVPLADRKSTRLNSSHT